MVSLTTRLLAAGLLATFSILPSAHAMSFEHNRKVVTLSGEVDYPDHGRLKDALKAGAEIVVLKDIGGSRVDASDSFRRLLRDKQLTIVLQGSCGGSCVTLFSAGKKRYFAKPETQIAAAYIAGAVEEGSTRPASSTETYTALDGILNDSMPRSMLNKYTTGWDGENYMAIAQPTTKNPEGALYECGGKKPCRQLDPSLTAVNIGFLTSGQLFDLETQTLIAAPLAPVKASDASK